MTEVNLKLFIYNFTKFIDQEIQRITVDISEFDRESFHNYIRETCGIMKPENISLQWQNSDSSWHNLLSMDDWELFKSFLFKLNHDKVKLNVYGGILHNNVICDNCENIVFGNRYKCLECDNFDLCHKCILENHNLHNHHCLLILRKPEDAAKMLLSIPYQGESSDFRVIDYGFAINRNYCSKINKVDKEVQYNVKMVNQLVGDFNELYTDTKNDIGTACEDNECTTYFDACDQKICEDKKSEANPNMESIVVQQYDEEYFQNFPPNSHQVFHFIYGMGYRDSTSLINLIIDKNCNVEDIIEGMEKIRNKPLP